MPDNKNLDQSQNQDRSKDSQKQGATEETSAGAGKQSENARSQPDATRGDTTRSEGGADEQKQSPARTDDQKTQGS